MLLLNSKIHEMLTMLSEKWTEELWMENVLLLNMLVVLQEVQIGIVIEEEIEEEIETEETEEIETEEIEIVDLLVDHPAKGDVSIVVEMAIGQEIAQMKVEEIDASIAEEMAILPENAEKAPPKARAPEEPGIIPTERVGVVLDLDHQEESLNPQRNLNLIPQVTRSLLEQDPLHQKDLGLPLRDPPPNDQLLPRLLLITSPGHPLLVVLPNHPKQ